MFRNYINLIWLKSPIQVGLLESVACQRAVLARFGLTTVPSWKRVVESSARFGS